MSVGILVRGWIWGVLLLVGAAVGALGQVQEEGAPAATVGAELRGLASRAGAVFVGRVAKIEPMDGVVEITFTVEQPVLGVVGGSYVMREWAGRWTGGQTHFQVGQRAMFFLRGTSAAGLSSAVDGMMGVVPVVPMGANGAALLDVRWLATRVKRAMGAPLTGAAMGAIALTDGVAVTRSWQREAVEEPKGVRLPEAMVATESVARVEAPVLGVGQRAGGMAVREAGDDQR
jgi:hypothetical protein